MARMTVTLPDGLAQEIQARLPGLNYSGVFQEALTSRLKCRHDVVACRVCTAVVDVHAAIAAALGLFYGDLLDELGALVVRGGTAEGAARVTKSVAERHHVDVKHRPLPRPTRGERRANQVKEINRPRRTA